jgi:putative tryptophan/tyrosine transport system substrate-binding protein
VKFPRSGPPQVFRRGLLHTLFFMIGACAAGTSTAAEDVVHQLAVLYPDIGEPYRSVFASIIEGIEDRTGGRVLSLPLTSNAAPGELINEIRRRDIHAVVTLGRQGMRMASSLDKGATLVAAGVLSVPESEAQAFSVHSLAPDPALLFARLKSLAPSVKRVLVVHDPRQNAWLMRLAREAAKVSGLDLQVRSAEDLKSAVKAYQDLLAGANPMHDAIWLPQDVTTVEDGTILPLLLKEAWAQNLVLFSSSVSHVRRGVLFALYPNNAELGRTLASAAMTPASSGTRGIQPLRDVMLAVNTRTANHLGLNLSATGLRFHTVFPEP